MCLFSLWISSWSVFIYFAHFNWYFLTAEHWEFFTQSKYKVLEYMYIYFKDIWYNICSCLQTCILSFYTFNGILRRAKNFKLDDITYNDLYTCVYIILSVAYLRTLCQIQSLLSFLLKSYSRISTILSVIFGPMIHFLHFWICYVLKLFFKYVSIPLLAHYFLKIFSFLR